MIAIKCQTKIKITSKLFLYKGQTFQDAYDNNTYKKTTKS